MEIKSYKRENVFNKTLDYFKGDELSTNVWINKYALKDADGNIYELSPEDMHWRLANEITRVEKEKYYNPLTSEELFELFDKFKYVIPQGSPMAGIGNNFQTTALSNCFVVAAEGEPDSYGGILRVDEEMIQLAKRRGGVGADLSHIRPKSSPVNNAAITSTGVVPFMERYSNSIKEVAQDGRRGALMLTISSKHPDSEDFVDAKMEQGKVTGANISVKVEDDLLLSAINGTTYTQTYPLDFKDFDNDLTIKNEIVSVTNKNGEKGFYKNIDGKKLWDKIIHNAWKSAEPGVLFWDTLINESVADSYADVGFKTISTNPCFTGDMRLLTADGYRTFEELDGKEEYLINELGEIVDGKVWCTGVKDTVVIRQSNGNVIKSTPDHRFKDIDGNEHQAKDLKGLTLMPYINKPIHSTNFMELGVEMGSLSEKELPATYFEWEKDDKAAFLSELFSRNISIIRNSDISFKINSKKLSEQLIESLKEFKIKGHIGVTPESYYINISGYENLLEFANTINFTQDDKTESLHQLLLNRAPKVTSVKKGETQKVYDFNLKSSPHWGVVENRVVHNCGELPLCSHDSCRLVAINLYSYVVNPFTKDAYFDFDLFSEHVGKTQRIMDDIVDLEIEKVEAILAKIESDPESESIKRVEKELWTNILNKAKIGRRTGLGITAEGDMLAGLGLIYGTPEATDFSERVHKVLAVNAYAESIKMAKERGAFGVWDYEKEKDNPFLKRILNELPEDIISMYKEYGRRNIACLTIAPTGSTSLMTQTTSGIEPVFLPVYKRRRKINPNDKNVRIDFIDSEGQSWEEYIVFHHKFSDWMEINGYDTTKNYSQNELNELVKKSPYYKATSNDVDWLEKVRMQGRIQKWVDHSISVTINLPNDVTEELVGNIYLEAWKSGCKGCTIYRDGSRDGVLVSADNKTDENKRGSDFVRPERLEAKIIHFQNNREKWVAVIGLVDGEPYEIFTGIKDEDDGIMVPKSVTEGNVLKIDNKETGEKRYDLEYVNKKGYKVTVEGLDSKFNEVYWNYAKLISGVLRYGMPVDQVVKLIKGLELDDDTINTWKNGVERAFKGFLPTTEMKGSTCPECGQETIVMTEGCLTCKSCGYSKCDS